jgi:hypothetical protein
LETKTKGERIIMKKRNKWSRTGTERGGMDAAIEKMGGGSTGSKFSRSNKIKEVQTKPKKSLKNQKPDRSNKTSEADAVRFNQPTGQGVGLGPRARIELEKKFPVAAKITNKKNDKLRAAKKPKEKKKFTIKPKGSNERDYKNQFGEWLDL